MGWEPAAKIPSFFTVSATTLVLTGRPSKRASAFPSSQNVTFSLCITFSSQSYFLHLVEKTGMNITSLSAFRQQFDAYRGSLLLQNVASIAALTGAITSDVTPSFDCRSLAVFHGEGRSDGGGDGCDVLRRKAPFGLSKLGDGRARTGRALFRARSGLHLGRSMYFQVLPCQFEELSVLVP